MKPRLLILLSVFSLLALGVSPPVMCAAHAQDAVKEKPQKPKKPKTRRSEVLGSAAFRLIEKARELAEQGKYDAALVPLQQILDGDKFKPYEKAVAMQSMGFVHADKNDYPATIAAFEQAVATGDLPQAIVARLTYNLAQLYLAEAKPQKALAFFEQWFDTQNNEQDAAAFALKAQIYLTLDDMRQAEQAIRKALLKVKEPQQSWTRILL